MGKITSCSWPIKLLKPEFLLLLFGLTEHVTCKKQLVLGTYNKINHLQLIQGLWAHYFSLSHMHIIYAFMYMHACCHVRPPVRPSV